MTKTIKRVVTAGAIEHGHGIQIELEFTDGSPEILRCEPHIAPSIARAVLEASAVAEMQRKLQPGEGIEIEIPYQATDLLVARARDNRSLAIKFLTKVGVPLVVAMTPNLARKTIERLSAQLNNLGKTPPSRPN
jgi:hypothetical protein